MNFFTRAWCTGHYDESAYDAVAPAYWRHIDAIADRLPPDLVAFHRTVSLHDGLIRAVDDYSTPGTLDLRLRCGDLQVGYFNADLRYQDVAISPDDLGTLSSLARAQGVELLYDELDVRLDGRIEHSIIFWPAGEVTVGCSSLTIATRPVPSRIIRRRHPRYIEE